MAAWPGTPPLSKWRLRNFKSVVDADLDLAPLTLIAGQNSSGKSSILQSMLLFAQAWRHNPTDEAFSLNGNLVTLGGIEDVRSLFAPTGEQVRIGATFDLGPNRARVPNTVRRPGFPGQRPLRVSELKVEWDLTLGGTTPNRPGSTNVEHNHVRVEAGGELSVCVDLDRRERAPAEDRRAYELGQAVVPTRANFSLAYHGSVDQQGTDEEPGEVFGALTRGAFPTAVLVRDRDIDLFAREWWDSHVARRSLRYRPSDTPERLIPETPEDRLQQLVTEAMRHLHRLRVDEDDETTRPAVARPMSRAAAELLSDPEIHGRFPEFVEALHEQAPAPEDVLTPARETWARLLEDAAGGLRRLLVDQTSYLGPLRQDPNIQQRTAVGTAADLGTKGELTPATLYAQRDSVIVCPELSGEPQRRPLGSAIAQWAAYLGIAEEVTPVDLGRPGIELRVRPRDLDRELDLTAVGVGVSQLLPVLVLCLLAEPGGIVLLEQPELHLHPAVQQRLGDFLLACARSGRQVIVETHSEHLIARLRRRAAEDETDDLVSLLTIVFAELEEGVTRLRTVRMNEYGGLEDWPRGFFDQGVSESRDILEVGLRKKQSREGSSE